MRRFLFILLLLVAVVGVVMYYVLTNLSGIIEATIEDYGSDATQTDVALNSVDISLADGSAALNGLTVGNPEGYSNNNAVSFGRINVQVDLDSLQSCGAAGCDVITLNEVSVESPEILYELGQGGNNLQTIQKNVEAYTASLSGGSSSSSSSSGPKLIINRLVIREGQISVRNGESKIADVPLPTIDMSGIGASRGGAEPGEIASIVVGRLMQTSLKAVATANIQDLIGGAGGIIDGAGGILEDGGKKAGDKIKGIFGRE